MWQFTLRVVRRVAPSGVGASSASLRTRGRGDWHQYADLFPGSLPDLAAEATRIRTYESILIPGPLQTLDYARGIFEASQIVPAEDTRHKVESRMAARFPLGRGRRVGGLHLASRG